MVRLERQTATHLWSVPERMHVALRKEENVEEQHGLAP